MACASFTNSLGKEFKLLTIARSSNPVHIANPAIPDQRRMITITTAPNRCFRRHILKGVPVANLDMCRSIAKHKHKRIKNRCTVRHGQGTECATGKRQCYLKGLGTGTSRKRHCVHCGDLPHKSVHTINNMNCVVKQKIPLLLIFGQAPITPHSRPWSEIPALKKERPAKVASLNTLSGDTMRRHMAPH